MNFERIIEKTTSKIADQLRLVAKKVVSRSNELSSKEVDDTLACLSDATAARFRGEIRIKQTPLRKEQNISKTASFGIDDKITLESTVDKNYPIDNGSKLVTQNPNDVLGEVPTIDLKFLHSAKRLEFEKPMSLDEMREELKNIEVESFFYRWGQQIKQKTSISDFLSNKGIDIAKVHPDSIRFLKTLNPDVINGLKTDYPNYLRDLLIKEKSFNNLDFSKIIKNANVVNLLSEIKGSQGESLWSRVTDIDFLHKHDFNANGYKKMLNSLQNTRIVQPETQKYNFSLIDTLIYQNKNYSITEILNSKNIDTEKVADFLDVLTANKITKPNGVQWSLSDITKENWLLTKVMSNTIDYDSATKMAKYLAENNKYAQLSDTDMDTITFLIENYSDKYMNPEDYSHAYDYFKGLTTKGNSKVYVGRGDYMSESDLIKYMLKINPGSVEASNMEMLLNLVVDGQVNPSVLNYMQSSSKLPKAVIDDINKLYNAYAEGIKPIDMFIPSVKSIDKGISEFKVGDVFEVKGNKNIFLKNTESGVTALDIDKESYFKLFPPVERYASAQGEIGNCWEVTGINTILNNPEERIKLLSCFSQDGEDILVKLPQGKLQVHFKNGTLPNNLNLDYFTKGADGVKMIEYVDFREMQHSEIERYFNAITNDIKNASDEVSREELLNRLSDFTNLVENSTNNLRIYKTQNGQLGYEILEDGIVPTIYRTGGESQYLWEKLGYKNARYVPNTQNYAMLKDPETFANSIIAFATKDDLNWKYHEYKPLGLAKEHAYRLNPVVENGEVVSYNIINPWGIFESNIDLERLEDISKGLYIADK